MGVMTGYETQDGHLDCHLDNQSHTLCMFSSVSGALCSSVVITYTREQLIGLTSAGTISLFFTEPGSFTDVFVGGAAALDGVYGRRQQ